MSGGRRSYTSFETIPLASQAEARFADALNIYPFNTDMYAENRLRLMAKFKNQPAKTVLLFKGGSTPTRYDTDFEPLFRQESNFAYLTGVKEADCYLLLLVDTLQSVLFIPKVPESYGVWMGHIKSLQEFKDEYKVDEVRYVEELGGYLKAYSPSKVHTLRNPRPENSNPFEIEAKLKELSGFSVDNTHLHKEIVNCRVIKSEKEIHLMRHINRISSEAHLWVMNKAQPGMKEFQLESLFNHYSYFRGQCRNQSYVGICGTGERGSYLHYGHAAAPNDQVIEDGDMCLLDMGAEFRCYTSDITCSFPINGRFTHRQALIYNAVLDAQWTVMEALKPGVIYGDMHRLSLRVICAHLLEIGILVGGSVDDMMKAEMGEVFMPHGLGHFLGLDTHDVGGSLMSREMRIGMVLTVEPGIYFNKYSLQRALNNKAKSMYIDQKVLGEYEKFGGVRIEDDVVITKTGIENLTKCPRTVKEIEEAMAGKIKSIDEIKENQF